MPDDVLTPSFDGTDLRRYDRVPADFSVTVRNGERRRLGSVANISANGALLRMESLLERLDTPLEPGRYVDVDIDNLTYPSARVVRRGAEGLAVCFDLDERQCLDLADQLVRH